MAKNFLSLAVVVLVPNHVPVDTAGEVHHHGVGQVPGLWQVMENLGGKLMKSDPTSYVDTFSPKIISRSVSRCRQKQVQQGQHPHQEQAAHIHGEGHHGYHLQVK